METEFQPTENNGELPKAEGVPGAPAPLPPQRLVGMALAFYGVMALLALAWRTGWSGEPVLYVDAEAAAAGLRPLRDGALGAAAGAAVIALSSWLTERTAWGEALARALAQLVGALAPGQIVLLALASGIGEELFFRGALQPRVGLVWASLLFALAHLVPRRDLISWTLFSGAAGFLLGGLFLWTGNLLAPVVAHALVNGVNLTLLVRQYGPGADQS